MAHYTSSRGNLALRIGSAILAIVGAVSFTAVWHGLRRAGIAMGDNPISSAALLIGIALIAVSYRDSLLGIFGWMSQARAERLIKSWLESQGYAIKKEPTSGGRFTLTATDDTGRNCLIMWQTTPFVGVAIGATWGVGENLKPIWSSATPADIRELQTRLMDVGARIGCGVTVNELNDAAKAQAIYVTSLPRDLVNYEEFFRRLNDIMNCKVMAINHMGHLLETLKERGAAGE